MNDFGVRWVEAVGKQMALTTKEKFFTTAELRTKFVAKLEPKGSFIEIVAWSDPRTGESK